MHDTAPPLPVVWQAPGTIPVMVRIANRNKPIGVLTPPLLFRNWKHYGLVQVPNYRLSVEIIAGKDAVVANRAIDDVRVVERFGEHCGGENADLSGPIFARRLSAKILADNSG